MKYLILVFTTLLLFHSCIKEECKITGGYYEFELTATLSPAKDTFKIGDTITFTSSFPDEVNERNTNQQYKLENFRFYPGTRITEISDSFTDPAAILEFEILIDSSMDFHRFDYSTGEIAYIGEYNYLNNKYNLNFKLIPKSTGFYEFRFGSSLVGLDDSQNFKGKCDNLKVSAVVKLNEGADNNIQMLSNSPDSHFNNWVLQKPQERFHDGGGYCFYVKE